MRIRFKIFFTCLIAVFILLGFAVPVNMAGNWTQQFMSTGLPNFQLSDIYFLDSLTGFAVTGNGSPNDSSGYILKTTNSGNNWELKFAEYRDFSRVKFINNNTGFVSGGYFNGARLYKTINSGDNWLPLNIPGGGQIYFDDMAVLNENIIWLVASNSLVGGVFFTSNGGSNWTQQYSGSNNPAHIYMYNARIGFADGPGLLKTTNGGLNWILIPGAGNFLDMFFIDSLTGWKANLDMKKTTNGGLNWVTQILPQGGNILFSQMLKFSKFSRDTIWGVGGTVFYGAGQFRGILFRTTNGGNNWLFQIPDTAIHIGIYNYTTFINKNIGWAYSNGPGIHTTTGGNDTFYIGIKQISTEIPIHFKLYQNYPNPFNPKTIIKYQIVNSKYQKKANVILIVFDITGKEVITLVNEEQSAGTYEVDFSGNGYSSGIYFYSLIVNGIKIDTRKMILLK